MSNTDELKRIASTIRGLGDEVRKHLGSGFKEEIYQAALAVEFRKSKIEYLREVNIEIFYKDESIGFDRPDFIITKIGSCKKPVILELKAVDKLTDVNRIQLRSYCTSMPKNNNPTLKDFAGGILMAFPKGDIGNSTNVKVYLVDRDFNKILDDQADEDDRSQESKEKIKKGSIADEELSSSG